MAKRKPKKTAVANESEAIVSLYTMTADRLKEAFNNLEELATKDSAAESLRKAVDRLVKRAKKAGSTFKHRAERTEKRVLRGQAQLAKIIKDLKNHGVDVADLVK